MPLTVRFCDDPYPFIADPSSVCSGRRERTFAVYKLGPDSIRVNDLKEYPVVTATRRRIERPTSIGVGFVLGKVQERGKLTVAERGSSEAHLTR